MNEMLFPDPRPDDCTCLDDLERVAAHLEHRDRPPCVVHDAAGHREHEAAREREAIAAKVAHLDAARAAIGGEPEAEDGGASVVDLLRRSLVGTADGPDDAA